MLRSVRRGTVGAPGPAGPLPVCAPYRCAGERGQPRFAVGETGALWKCFQHCSPGEQYGRPHREEACPCLPVSRGSITRGAVGNVRPNEAHAAGTPGDLAFPAWAMPGHCINGLEAAAEPARRDRCQTAEAVAPPSPAPHPVVPVSLRVRAGSPGAPGDTGPSLICLRLEAFRRDPASRPCQRTPTHVTESPPPGQSSQHRKPAVHLHCRAAKTTGLGGVFSRPRRGSVT